MPHQRAGVTRCRCLHETEMQIERRNHLVGCLYGHEIYPKCQNMASERDSVFATGDRHKAIFGRHRLKLGLKFDGEY